MKRATLNPPTESMPQSARIMKAIVQDDYGTAPEDVLRLAEVTRPAIGDDEVLVRVHAASVDRGTWHIMAGLPYPIRVAGFGLRKPKYLNPGRSLAGTVEAVGKNVTGVCGTAKVDLVRTIGADHTVDYTRDDFADAEHRFDAILDIGGNRRLSRLRHALTSKGTLVIVGGETDGRWIGGFDRQLRAQLLSPLVSQKLGTFVADGAFRDRTEPGGLLAVGQASTAIQVLRPACLARYMAVSLRCTRFS
jgi:NADPH:quinone reductase-like Zn-dependent oxidoreductase